MDFGLDSLRSLLEDFLSNSGGRRGRERERQRQQRDSDSDGDDDAGQADGQSGASPTGDETAADDTGDAESGATERRGGGGGLFSRGSAADEDDLDDLYYRIEELEEELENKGTKLGSVRESQQQVADQVEEMNDTVRQLLGVYDMLTDDVNPFTGAGEERKGFGVFGEDDQSADSETETAFDRELGGSSGREETVSFDDLKGVIEDAAAQSAAADDESRDETNPFSDSDDTRVEVQATESVEDPEPEPAADEEATDDGSDVTLETLADTYATDIIILEWLTELLRTGGPAATLRAISYYAEIGWIDDEVKSQLEATLSGPDLDIHVDPGATPDELTAEDHADSYTYIMKLQEIHDTKREVEPNSDTRA